MPVRHELMAVRDEHAPPRRGPRPVTRRGNADTARDSDGTPRERASRQKGPVISRAISGRAEQSTSLEKKNEGALAKNVS
jgi:hypothetical protein